MRTIATMHKQIKLMDCDWCGNDVPHEVARPLRVERGLDCDVTIVKYVITCKCCGAIRIEKRMVVPNE